MALVDHDYCFTYINVGANGSASDGACSLHNWLRKKSSNYMTTSCVDHDDHNDHHLINGTWRSEITSLDSIIQQGSNNSATHAREKRTQFTNYFVNEGKVPWQNHMIH
ncbi:Uncharacterized protein OBRU01_23697 [Operophtera brumata]|uniref:Uncharacterized protein n=1 Tax=Operophtera brumata TaxID=104452 RepID=A0A0L7KNN4_OPEBR|nr:Uncharacterized protein OBRU01_23697 [Operophtera brumata]